MVMFKLSAGLIWFLAGSYLLIYNKNQLATVFTVERHRARDFGNLVHLIDFAWRYLNLGGLFVDRTRETQAYQRLNEPGGTLVLPLVHLVRSNLRKPNTCSRSCMLVEVFSELEHLVQLGQWPRTPFNKKTTRINKVCFSIIFYEMKIVLLLDIHE